MCAESGAKDELHFSLGIEGLSLLFNFYHNRTAAGKALIFRTREVIWTESCFDVLFVKWGEKRAGK